MEPALPLRGLTHSDGLVVGGKALRLGRMLDERMNVPDGVAVPTTVYRKYVAETGVSDAISIELARRKEAGMRWEEMWDASLRIRNLFLRTPLPSDIESALADICGRQFGTGLVCVRSSAPGEDEGGSSFAGLHSSFVGVSGTDQILRHMRLVWASLWSDGALLYRKEIGLDVKDAAMAVVIQEFRKGEVSGVVFSRDPSGAERMVCEAVPGLNEGLVDGTVPPDRWFISREDAAILEYQPGHRQEKVVIGESGTMLAPLEKSEAAKPLLDEAAISKLHHTALELERLMAHPQDVEWTLSGSSLSILQSRNITTSDTKIEEGSKAWQLTLRRSFENLRQLKRRLEDEVLPSMLSEYEELKTKPLEPIADDELVGEYRLRKAVKARWRDLYWKDCIPMAHGMRLFGEIYNDTLAPDDPHEFILLLAGEELDALKRNKEFTECRDRTDLKTVARNYGADFLIEANEQALTDFANRLAESGRKLGKRDCKDMERRYFESFGKEQSEFAQQLLELARASYRLRDNDNVVLGKVDVAIHDVIAEARRRKAQGFGSEDIEAILDDAKSPEKEEVQAATPGENVSQVTGQPSGPGIGIGKAHVIRDKADILSTQPGDVLVCDAIDPTMTIAVPLCAGIVERRGGMLIHGAIIAREYGLPCVTGIDNAVDIIPEGANVTVDGYLGIVRIDR